MAEDLNHFAKYLFFIFNNIQRNGCSILNLNFKKKSIEYYTKRGLDPPKTIHGDPAKILDHQDPQRQEQTKEVNNIGSVHHFAYEINRLCLEVGKIIQKPQAIKDQLNHKKKKSQEKLQNHPQSDMQIQSLKQINTLNDFNSQIQQQTQKLQIQDQQYDVQHIRGDQSIRLNGLKQNLQLSLSPQNQQIVSLQQQMNNHSKHKKKQFHNYTEEIINLYCLQRNEQSKKMKNNQKLYVSSLTELSQHQDEEIQKAFKILQ